MSELTLHTIKSASGSRKSKKRVGRGWASKGKYSGRGRKGQRSRSGGKSGLKKRGLRPVMLNIPKKRGFTSPHSKEEVVNVSMLDKKFATDTAITPKILKESGLISTVRKGVKILGQGELSKKLSVKDCKVSASAKEKIEKAGGNVA